MLTVAKSYLATLFPSLEEISPCGGTRLSLYFLLLCAFFLAAAAFTCLVLAVGNWPKLSKTFLLIIAAGLAILSLLYALSALLHGGSFVGVAILFCGFSMTAGFAFLCVRLNFKYANALLLCIGLQCVLCAFDSIRWLSLPGGVAQIVAATHASSGQRLWTRQAGLVQWGNLACAVAVSHVLQDAEVSEVLATNVEGLQRQLVAEGWQKVLFSERKPGDVIIALGSTDQHTGIVGETRDITFHNHSSNGRWLPDSANYWVGTKLWDKVYALRCDWKKSNNSGT
jgi:hypothetical protein